MVHNIVSRTNVMMQKLDLKASKQCGVQLKLKADAAVLDCKLKFLWVSELKFKLQEGVSADLAYWELGKIWLQVLLECTISALC